MRRKIAIGIFNNSVKIRGQDPSQNIGPDTRISFLTSGTERISSNFSVKKQNNMHSLDQACTYNLLLVTNISDSKILPF